MYCLPPLPPHHKRTSTQETAAYFATDHRENVRKTKTQIRKKQKQKPKKKLTSSKQRFNFPLSALSNIVSLLLKQSGQYRLLIGRMPCKRTHIHARIVEYTHTHTNRRTRIQRAYK